MEISEKRVGDVAVVAVSGNLDTNTAPQAQSALEALVGDGGAKIVVNCEDLDYISSAGLRVLLATAKRLRGTGGALRICSLNETVSEIFEISGFNTIFSVFDDEQQALDGF